MSESALRDGVIVASCIADQGFLQAFRGIETGGGEDVSDAAVETLDHAIGLRMTGSDQAVLDAVLTAEGIERKGTGGLPDAGSAEAIGELFPVVGEVGDLHAGIIPQPRLRGCARRARR